MSGVALQAEALGAFLRNGLGWWVDGLEATLPRWLIAAVLGDRRCVLVEDGANGDLIARLLPSPGSPIELARASLKDGSAGPTAQARAIKAAALSRPVVIVAPAQKVLTQVVRVPTAALENLTEAVRFGLTTWTPFSAGEVIFRPSVVEQGADHAKIRIDMILRRDLESIVARATQAGLRATGVALSEEAVGLDADDIASKKRLSRGNRIDLGLLVSALILALGLIVMFHVRSANEHDRLQDEVRAEIGHRAKQSKLENEISQLETRQRNVLAKRASEPRVSEVIADLTERIPETAEVVEFEWSGAHGRVKATNPEVSGLEEALNASPLMAAKPQRTNGENSFGFELSAKPQK